MKSFIHYLSLALICMSVQSMLFSVVKPDIVIILVCFYTLRYGQSQGIVYGAAAGLILDSASGFIIGPNILSKASAAFLIGVIRRKVLYWSPVFNLLVICVVSLLDIILVRICLETFSVISYANRLPVTAFVQMVITGVFSLIMYPFFNPERVEGNNAE